MFGLKKKKVEQQERKFTLTASGKLYHDEYDEHHLNGNTFVTVKDNVAVGHAIVETEVKRAWWKRALRIK